MNLQKTQFMCLSRRCWEKEADSLQVRVNDEVLRGAIKLSSWGSL